jgi:uncharacterized protein YggE
MNRRRSMLVLPLYLILQELALGQAVPPPSIQVSAEAVVTAKPDQAQMEIGVVTQGNNAQSTAQDNSQRVESTMAAIRKVLGDAGEIKTIGYSVHPNYRYLKEGGTPTISGYTVSNVIRVTTSDLTVVGRLVDAATSSGANTIQQLQFTLRDEQAVQLQALREASTKAKAKAQAIAAALGLKIVRVLHADEQGGVVRPLPERMLSMNAGVAGSIATPTPVETGSIEVRATVTLTVEVGQ